MHDLLTEARERDARDAHASRREDFFLPVGPPTNTAQAYFCGNSLGLQPRAAAKHVHQELERWATLAVRGHFVGPGPWYSYDEPLRPALARLVGATEDEVVAMGSLTNNLHLLFVSFYQPTPQRYKILCEAGAFPSDRYLLESQTRFHGFDPADAIVEVHPNPDTGAIEEAEVEALLQELGDQVALVFFAGVHFRTGQRFDLARLTRAAHRVGAVAGFDLAHAVGNIPLHLHDAGADFAAWCSYKYLNAGPGAVAGLFVHQRHAAREDLPRFAGWWGVDPASRFRMEPGFTPQRGAAGWQLSNAPVLPMAALRASLDVFDDLRIQTLWERAQRLSTFLLEALDASLGARVEVLTPTPWERRGCQTSLRLRADASSVQRALEHQGVITDERPPDILRVAPVPLYNTYEDIARFVSGLDQVLRS